MRRWLWLSAAIVASGCALAPPPAEPLYTVRATCAFGVPDGAYALVLASGVAQVSGTFSQGRKNGVFTILHSSGEKVSWFSDGPRRSVLHYTDGRLDRAEAWERDGDALSAEQAEALASADLEADRRYYDVIESVISENPARCS